MDDSIAQQILTRLNQLEERLLKLENNLKLDKKSVDQPIQTIPENIQIAPQIKSSSPTSLLNSTFKKNDSHMLGYIGAACILMAAILLIKFSIASGWLTPIRQCFMAIFLGLGLISIPFVIKDKDKSYFSMLPALGIVILHLTSYGATRYHHLFDSSTGLFAITIIGALSLFLLTRFNQMTYALLAIVGTYVGILFFHDSFNNSLFLALYLFTWDISFALFSIYLKNRQIITISSYLSIGLIGLLGISIIFEGQIGHIIVIQAIQFLIYSLGTIGYSLWNKDTLSDSESINFLPVIVFFYGVEYYFLNRLSESYAFIFSILFSVFLLSLYAFVKIKLKDKNLASGSVVYTSTSIIFAHSVFLVQMNDLTKVLFALFLSIVIGYFKDQILQNKNLKGSIIVSALMILFAYLFVLFGMASVQTSIEIIFGLLIGSIILYYVSRSEHDLRSSLIYLAHIQVIISLFRLKEYFGTISVAPLVITYVFVILLWSTKIKEKYIAKSALPLIFIGLARFIFFDFSGLSGIPQILSLFVMGGLIYIGGYLYRKV